LEQIIFELNKTSEGMRKRYESEEEPLLSDYFPTLGKVKKLGNVEILDGGEENAADTPAPAPAASNCFRSPFRICPQREISVPI